MTRDFRELLEQKWADGKFVCVGLDPVFESIPECVRGELSLNNAIAAFSRKIVNATRDLVCAYKPNIAFYESYGVGGVYALAETIGYIHRAAPDVPVILDTKCGDVGSTSERYVAKIFDEYAADACTISPYLGGCALKPFLDRKDKGIFVVCRTSNTGADEFQKLVVGEENIPLYHKVARNVAWQWNTNENCGLVMGAAHAYNLRVVRYDAPDIPILIPGIGEQGGDLKEVVAEARSNFIVSSSRSIIYASSGSDFADAARREVQHLHDDIQMYRRVSVPA
ncbi:MAG TPA: orotidine-5'-phosphate decarboxylase [Candidatus Paceibacterota bacterium]|nr:orotidine-5'-phosphate decarboxylase [Candidatus Paceibacterota bacterium]